MNETARPLITLSQIQSIPDGYLHSKISFLKSVINEQQNPELLEMKQKMYKMSYTIKNIGIHGQEIGITSKRMPLKSKQSYIASQIDSQKKKQMFRKKYIPHNTFYSQALIPIKKYHNDQNQNTGANQSKNQFMITSSLMNANQFFQKNESNANSLKTKFAKKMQMRSTSKFGKNFSHSSTFRSGLNTKQNNNKKQQELRQKMTVMKRSSSETEISKLRSLSSNKKSFSKLLNQYQLGKKSIQLLPLQHEGNPLFKKIKKLQNLAMERNQSLYKDTQILRNFSRGSFVGRYNTTEQTARYIESRVGRKIGSRIQ